MKKYFLLILFLNYSYYSLSIKAFGSSIMALRFGGSFMNNYNLIYGGELGFFHTAPLNCHTYQSPYGYYARAGLYFDRYFNILDGTVFKSALYRRMIVPISYGGYLSLQGILELYGLVNERRKKTSKPPWIDIHLGLSPAVYFQRIWALEKNMKSENLIPKEHPVLRGADYALFLGANAHVELYIYIYKQLSISLKNQMDFFIYPIPLGKFPNQNLNPNLPTVRTKAAMNLNKPILPSFLISLNFHFVHNKRKRIYKSYNPLFKTKARSFDMNSNSFSNKSKISEDNGFKLFKINNQSSISENKGIENPFKKKKKPFEKKYKLVK